MQPISRYLDYSGRDDVVSGGARRIPVTTPAGEYHVWVKRVGNNPELRLLLLHGGPGATHEYLEACNSYLPAAGIEYYYYDQLGSGFSDPPDEPSLWEVDRFVDEVMAGRLPRGRYLHCPNGSHLARRPADLLRRPDRFPARHRTPVNEDARPPARAAVNHNTLQPRGNAAASK